VKDKNGHGKRVARRTLRRCRVRRCEREEAGVRVVTLCEASTAAVKVGDVPRPPIRPRGGDAHRPREAGHRVVARILRGDLDVEWRSGRLGPMVPARRRLDEEVVQYLGDGDRLVVGVHAPPVPATASPRLAAAGVAVKLVNLSPVIVSIWHVVKFDMTFNTTVWLLSS
jgi:hypothetical protein